MTIDELNKRFGIAGRVKFECGNGDLARAIISTTQAEAEIYLHGAHITHFQPKGAKPVLWMSRKAVFAADKPIRGGVPICFPWFASGIDEKSQPMHGLVRLREWDVQSARENSDGSMQIIFALELDGEYALRYIVNISAKLEMALEVKNIAERELHFEEALHTYLNLGDARQVSINGLENADYIDRMREARTFNQGTEPVRFTAETDRVYLNTASACLVDDPVLKRKIRIETSGSKTTVVWNPWIAKARAMADFGDDEWPEMCCIETSNVKKYAVKLPAGQTHTMRAMIHLA